MDSTTSPMTVGSPHRAPTQTSTGDTESELSSAERQAAHTILDDIMDAHPPGWREEFAEEDESGAGAHHASP